MKFITIVTLESAKIGSYDTTHININSILLITDHWVEKKDCDSMDNHAKIILTNGIEIIADESLQWIEEEYKELFKQF